MSSRAGDARIAWRPRRRAASRDRAPSVAAFADSTDGRRMLEHTTAGARLATLVLHDNAKREYAYGPAQGLRDTTVRTLTPALGDDAKKWGRVGAGMKDDGTRILVFDSWQAGFCAALNTAAGRWPDGRSAMRERK